MSTLSKARIDPFKMAEEARAISDQLEDIIFNQPLMQAINMLRSLGSVIDEQQKRIAELQVRIVELEKS